MKKSKGWKKRFEGLWWLRGIASAITISALVPSFIDISRLQFLHFFHAVIVGWNDLLDTIGAWLLVDWLPWSLTHVELNTLAFATAFIVPLAFGRLAMFKAEENASIVSIDFAKHIATDMAAYISTLMMFYIAVSGRFFELTTWNWMTKVGLYGAAPCSVAIVVIGLCILGKYKRGYVKGLFLFVSFVGTFEVLALVNSPFLGNTIRAFTCEQLEQRPPYCDPTH